VDLVEPNLVLIWHC